MYFGIYPSCEKTTTRKCDGATPVNNVVFQIEIIYFSDESMFRALPNQQGIRVWRWKLKV